MNIYDRLIAVYQELFPGRPVNGDEFNAWTQEVMNLYGVGTWEELPIEEISAEVLLPKLGYEAVAENTQPLEQQIAQTAVPNLVKQIEGDAARGAEVEDLTKQTGQAFGTLRDTLGMTTVRTDPVTGAPTSTLLDAQRANADATVKAIVDAAAKGAGSQTQALATLTANQLGNLEQSMAAQRAALQQQITELQGNATEAANSRRAALEQQMAALTAAQQPVAEARLRAAENEVTGINLGLQSTQDDLRAEAAREGFYGGSTMEDAALARAAVDARQGAARSMGNARLANATDDRSLAEFGAGARYSIADALAEQTQRIGDFGASGRGQLSAFDAETGRNIRDTGATGRFTIASNLADETKGAETQGALAKAGYFDQLYPNAVNSAQILAGLPAAEAGAKMALLPYGTAGTNNALNTLNWWTSNATAPNPTAVTVSPSTTGNSIAGLGAGLMGSAFQIGNSENWWKPPATKAAPNTVKTPTYANSVWPSWTTYGKN